MAFLSSFPRRRESIPWLRLNTRSRSATDVTHLNAFQAFAWHRVGGQGGAQLRIAIAPVLPDVRDSTGDLGV
jgi:hypothetical protein